MAGDKDRKIKGSTEPEAGWHKIPDAVVDELLLKSKLSPGGLQLSLLLIIQRHTWGAKGRPTWAKLSIAKLAKMCSSGRGKGDGYTPRAIATALNDMIVRGIIAGKNAKGQPLRAALTPEERSNAAKSTAAAMYQSTPDRWKAAKKYVAPATEEDEPTLVAEDAATEEDEPAPVEKGTPIVLQPGAKSKPMPMRITVKGRDPVDISWRAHNTSPSPLSFFAAPSSDGLLFTVAQKGEPKANDYVSRIPQAAARESAPSPGGYASCLNSLMLRHWKKTADAGFIAKIIAHAKGAPVELFSELVENRLGPTNRKNLQSGILLDLAKDAARAYAATRSERETAERAQRDALQRQADEEAYWRQEESNGGRLSPWSLARKAIKQQVSKAVYENWFARSRFIRMEGKAAIVELPDPGSVSYVESEFAELIHTNVRALHCGVEIDSVRFVAREAAMRAAS